MNRTWVLTTGGMAMALGIGVTAALALPLGPSPADAPNVSRADDGLIQKVHGCHRSCEWGPVFRWHRHAGAACRPVACAPLAPQPNRCWIDAWGARHCRW